MSSDVDSSRPYPAKVWTNLVRDYLYGGDMSMWRSKQTGELHAVGQISTPSPAVPIIPVSPDTDKTQVVPSIKPGEIIRYDFPHKKKLPYDYIDYRSMGNPLLTLKGAAIECYKRFQRLPDVLYISRRLEPALERESRDFWGAYDGMFRMYHPQALAGIKKIPVLTETHLPDDLKMLMAYNFPVDCCLALVER